MNTYDNPLFLEVVLCRYHTDVSGWEVLLVLG